MQEMALTTNQVNEAFEAVFRSSTEQPGFYYLDLGPNLDSQSFRRIMVELMNGVMSRAESRLGRQLKIQWIGRFDHQHTSRFHRDNAAAHSFLLLGYEPTEIESSASVADYSKWIQTQGLTVEDYFGDPEVNTAADDSELDPVASTLGPFTKNHYRLLLLNNGKSTTEPALGVFHRGEVTASDSNHDRVINSIMLYLDDGAGSAQPSSQEVEAFITTTRIDR